MEKVIVKAKEALRNSYSPYSNFPVGAAVEVSDGTIFLGTNVENVVNGASICAEQNAINAAISNGYKGSEIKRIAIFAPTKNLTYPCSLCRQVFVEFLMKNRNNCY